MSTEDDIARLAELARELPAPDLDAPTAARIAWRARADVGKGPGLQRILQPVIAGAIVIPYAVWVILEVLKLL